MPTTVIARCIYILAYSYRRADVCRHPSEACCGVSCCEDAKQLTEAVRSERADLAAELRRVMMMMLFMYAGRGGDWLE